jgi:hypothetical protein
MAAEKERRDLITALRELTDQAEELTAQVRALVTLLGPILERNGGRPEGWGFDPE